MTSFHTSLRRVTQHRSRDSNLSARFRSARLLYIVPREREGEGGTVNSRTEPVLVYVIVDDMTQLLPWEQCRLVFICALTPRLW